MTGIDWRLHDDKGNPVCNFIPTVKSVIIASNGTVRKDIACVSLAFGNGETAEVQIDSTKLDKANWSDIDYRCIVNTNQRGARNYIVNAIRNRFSTANTVKKPLLNHLGIHIVNGNILYVAGDKVISKDSNEDSIADCFLDDFKYRLDIDKSISPKEAFKGMVQLMDLCPEISHFLIAHVVTGLFRTAYIESRITPEIVLFIIGKTGMRKSSYVSHLVQLYNRSDYIRPDTRFNSTDSVIEEILYEHEQCTSIIDDIHTGESKKIMNESKTRAEALLRQVSDNISRGHKNGNETVLRQFNGNAVFIGEYSFGEGSTIPRMLEIQLTESPDSSVLDYYQRQKPLLVSTFYYYLIKWYVTNYQKIKYELDRHLTQFRKYQSTTDIHGRLLDAQFCLQTSYGLFIEFCCDSGFFKEEDGVEEIQIFKNSLAKAILNQQHRMNSREVDVKEVDYLGMIKTMYHHGAFKVASDRDKFDPLKHDGLIYNDCLCLQGGKIDSKVTQQYPHAARYEWVHSLDDKGVLKTKGNNKSIQVSGCHGIRFYAIYLDKMD